MIRAIWISLTFAEAMPGGVVKILVAIADVDAVVKKQSALDDHARHNTTSVLHRRQDISDDDGKAV
jgi:exoribonuclease R